MKKFSGEYPFPTFSKSILQVNRKTQTTFERREIDEKFQSRRIPNRVKKWNGDVTAILTCPLVAEIVFSQFSATRKALLTSKR
jgi:hypothetical protein